MPDQSHDRADLLPIRRVAQETGIRETTLRAWERRYGRPTPLRLPSGQRRYRWEDVLWLRQVAELLAQGERPGELLQLAPERLAERRLDCRSQELNPVIEQWFELLFALRSAELKESILTEAKGCDPVDFLEGLVSTFLQEVGHRWVDGRLAIRHEHLAADVLRSVIASLTPAAQASEPVALLTSLTDERHGLPLQMAALVCASRKVAVTNLGVDTPLAEIVAAVRERQLQFVAITVSLATGGVATDRLLTRLRAELPDDVDLVVGGGGARRARRGPKGVIFLSDLTQFADWLENKFPRETRRSNRP
ncbi:MAG: methanogenic corrinoid protein MtbC1 [Pseudohongiellaceae bacterium]|jgi:methanogenic corrinoid protein MtbC1